MNKIAKTITYSIIFILFSASSLLAQKLNVILGEADLSGFPKICMDIAVKDSTTGQMIAGFTDKNVTVFEDTLKNKSINIESIKERGDKISFLVAVDASKSMDGEPIDSIKSALKNFIGLLSPEDQLGIITFHDEIELISDFNTNRDILKSQIDSIYAKGTITELYYGIVSGLNMLSDSKNLHGNKVLIVLSDGKDEGSAYSDDDCIEKAKNMDIPIYTIGYRSKAEKKYLRVLERISDKTGGLYNYAPTTDKINSIYNEVFSQIQERTRLCFETELFTADSLEHIVSVLVKWDNKEGHADLTFTSPPGSQSTISAKKPVNWLIVSGISFVILLLVFLAILSNKKEKEKERIRFLEERERLEKEKRELDEREREKAKDKKNESTVIHKKEASRHTIIAGKEAFRPISLTFDNGPLGGQTKTIEGQISIGRRKDNGIIIDEQTISGNHCKIELENNQYVISDLGSTNGTLVNGTKISKIQINLGDTIDLGAIKITVK